MPEYDVDPEYAHGFSAAIVHAHDLAAELARAIAEIERLQAQAPEDPEVDAGPRRDNQMNSHERGAWRVLLGLGARLTELGGRPTLDLRPIRATSEKKLRLLVQACLAVAGRSGCNRRHVDRAGVPVYVVTYDPNSPRRP